jgi:hypothetical protein
MVAIHSIIAIRTALDTLKTAGDRAEIVQLQSAGSKADLRDRIVALLAELDDARSIAASANKGLDDLVSRLHRE